MALAVAAVPASAQSRTDRAGRPADATLPFSDADTARIAAPTPTSPWFAGEWQERPRRQTLRGARVGAVLGALGGLGLGVGVALVCRIEGSSEGDNCDGFIPLITVAGALSGAAAGAIVGAGIPTEPARPGTPAPTPARRIGSAGLSVGYSRGTVEDYSGERWLDSDGFSARAAFHAELRPWFATGPEAGITWFADGQQIRHVALAARGMPWPGHRLSPFLTGNLGAYQVTGPSLEFLGGGIGAGARWQPTGGRTFLDIEARLSANAQNIEPMRMRGFFLGGGIYW